MINMAKPDWSYFGCSGDTVAGGLLAARAAGRGQLYEK